MAREDVEVVNEFKKVTLNHLKDVLMVLPAIVPQSKADEQLFREGIQEISNLVYDIEHAENVRELSRFIDVQKVIDDFDTETIKSLNHTINYNASQSVMRLDTLYSSMCGDEFEQ